MLEIWDLFETYIFKNVSFSVANRRLNGDVVPRDLRDLHLHGLVRQSGMEQVIQVRIFLTIFF